MKTKLFLAILAVLVILLVAMPTAAQTIKDRVQGILVEHDAWVFGNLKVGDGTPSTAQDGEDAYVEGGLEVDGAAIFDGSADFDGAVDLSGATLSAAFPNLTVTGATALNGGITADSTAFTVADTSGNTQIGGTLGVTGAATLASADVTGALNYGADNLYPLGYASDAQQIVCGTTVAFTATHAIAPTGMTTPTYVVASQITQPAATAAFLTAQAPTTTTFELYSWGADYNAGTSGITAHWCAIGDQ